MAAIGTLMVVASVGVPFGQATRAAAVTPSPTTTPAEAMVANQVIAYVNAKRSALGLPTLVENGALDEAAQSLANGGIPAPASVAPFEPEGWDGGGFVWASDSTGSFPAASAVNIWLKSPSAVNSVLGGLSSDPEGEIGVGVGCAANGTEFVQVATVWKTATADAAVQSPGNITSAYAGCGGDPGGVYEVASDGGVFAFGDAPFYGSAGSLHLNKPIVGMSRMPADQGYWLVASDGGIFAYGGAPFYGSMGGKPLNKPIVGMASTPDGKGYWLVASDGGIFAFGDAQFYGSTGSIHLNEPVVGMARTVDGRGYWFVAADGGVFAFGDAGFYGSAAGAALSPVVGIATAGSAGYLVAEKDEQVLTFGDAENAVDPGGSSFDFVGIVTFGDPGGFFLADAQGTALSYGDYWYYYLNFNMALAGPLNAQIVGVG